MLESAVQVRREPVYHYLSKSVENLQPSQESVVIDTVEGRREVEECKHRQVTRIQRQKYVNNFKYGHLRRMAGPAVRLKVRQQIIVL